MIGHQSADAGTHCLAVCRTLRVRASWGCVAQGWVSALTYIRPPFGLSANQAECTQHSTSPHAPRGRYPQSVSLDCDRAWALHSMQKMSCLGKCAFFFNSPTTPRFSENRTADTLHKSLGGCDLIQKQTNANQR
jgi:hypothetical protein